jgi:hypothetical protein
VTGSTLLEHFGSPPHDVPPDVLEATVVGLLRGRRVRIEQRSFTFAGARRNGRWAASWDGRAPALGHQLTWRYG